MSQVATGIKLSFKINGRKVAFASAVSINEDNAVADIDVLDQPDVAELAETGHKVNFTVNKFKVDGTSAEDLGLRPTNIEDLIRQGELTCEVYNRDTDEVEYTLIGVKWTGGSGSVDARGVWQGTWNFRARRGGGSL
jgi:hypothetical protein